MGRSAAVSGQNNFVKGLVTEATGLNFPEDACTDTDNCVFSRKGSVSRRLGIDFEADATTQTVSRAGSVVHTYYWKAAAGNGDNTIAVVQVGDTLYFYKVESSALSSDMIDIIDLTVHEVAGASDIHEVECQFASGNGFLFVSHPNLETIYIEYDSGTDTVTANEITIDVRDFEGVEDNLDIDERPNTLSNEHEYNLFNQGWDVNANTSDHNFQDVLPYFEIEKGVYPSNADIWWLFKDATDDFDPDEITGTVGNSPAPKGHYILSAFFKDRSTVSGVAGIPVESAGIYRASTVAFFAGRVWYSGVTGQDYSNKIYFSQIVEETNQFGRCYQSNDPSSEDTFDLLASDGGVITIPEAGTIIKLWPIQNSLLVFASNGTWGISGSEGIGFKATDFSVNKLSDVGALTSSSFVSVGGFPGWWNEEDIYIASAADINGNIQVSPLVDTTIKEFYEDIPQSSKRFVKGAYNTRTRVVQWVYRSTASANLTEAYEFDRVLNFNTVTQAFYPWSVDDSSVSINGVLVVEGQASTTQLVDVTDNALDVVTDAAMDAVQVEETSTVDLSSVTKFISTYLDSPNYQLTFSDENNALYRDWVDFDETGVDFTSHFVTGYALHGEAQRKFQPTYVYIYNKTNADENEIDFQSQWNYANTGDTGRWSSVQRLVFPNSDYDYQYKRIKTRGHGLALQFRVTSVTGQPFDISGWSVYVTQNQLI